MRFTARYHNLEEIENIPIRTLDGATHVRLKDVADVVYGSPPRRWRFRIDGQDAAGFDIYKESEAYLADVCDRVIAAMPEIEEKPGAGFNVFWNQGKLVRESIVNLRNTGLWGGLFTALVLFCFLRSVRMTAIITLAIPLCVMITVSVLYFVDWSLNLLTMLGLMVGLGMIVDNAIVIVENVYRMRANVEQPPEAAIHGASEVGQAITMATLAWSHKPNSTSDVCEGQV